MNEPKGPITTLLLCLFVGFVAGADLDTYSWGGKRVAGDFEGWHPLAEVYADLITVYQSMLTWKATILIF